MNCPKCGSEMIRSDFKDPWPYNRGRGPNTIYKCSECYYVKPAFEPKK